MLKFHDQGYNPFEQLEASRYGTWRSFHDGQVGGAFEQVVYLRNDDPTTWYSQIVASYTSPSYSGTGELGATGWGVKLMYGARRPTESEWDLVRSGEAIDLPDIGSTAAADTSHYHPIWVRIYCPGGTAAQRRADQQLKITFNEHKVGA